MRPRTYSHLAELGRRPSEYDIASTRLLYYPGRGFSTNAPIGEWYRRHQAGSPVACSDWEQFRDPRETTYAKYTELQRGRETFLDGAHAAAEASGHDRALAPAWLELLAKVIPVLRFPCHGLQMIAAYVGQMAPSGRIVIASLFQAADEMRRVQRFAYRMRELQRIAPDFGAASRSEWESSAMWQPLREVIERLLVAYDWAETFVGLDLALKPRLDALLGTHLAALAQRSGDSLLGSVLFSLDEDCRWHRAWSRDLLALMLRDRADNRAPIEAWRAKWDELARRAIVPLATELFGAEAPRVIEAVEQGAAP